MKMKSPLLLLALLTSCADKHALQLSVTCKYPDNPAFDQDTHGRIRRADLRAEITNLPDFWLLPDGGVEVR